MSKKTIESIVAGGNNYIVTIKGNQPNLQAAAIELVESATADDYNFENECLHGRRTTREVKVYQIPMDLFPGWSKARYLIQVERSGTRIQGKKSRRHQIKYHERHFYLTSLDCSAAEFAQAIRGHWSIENRLHWVKDVTLNEDNSIYIGHHAAANWAMVRQFLVSVARHWNVRTFPDALRTIANEVRQVFDVLFRPVTSVDALSTPSVVNEFTISYPDN